MDKNTVLKFVDVMNSQNLSMHIEMMSEDFQFIDKYGGSNNKEHMKTGWQGYFYWFPDYRNR